MFYFGPWDRAGHFLVDENGNGIYGSDRGTLPWVQGQMDGALQPHFRDCAKNNSYRDRFCNCSSGEQGVALVHHKGGWTAMAFWDRSVDNRGASNSVYLAEGIFTFDEMVELAKTRFAYRWNKMSFPVTEFEESS